MEKKRNKLPIIIGVAAFEAYRFYKGKGFFNKIRYAKQHDAVGNYIETHYPGAFYSDITPTEDGWSCIATVGSERIVIYFTKTSDDTFVFWEKQI